VALLLNDKDKADAVAGAREMILASGQQAILMRRADGENLYGNDGAEYTQVAPGLSFPIEFIPTPPEDLSQKIDATACVLPELDVRAEDRVQVNGTEYRVQTVVEQNLFGVVTHKVLKLVRHHGG
jgi:hypothetical protein